MPSQPECLLELLDSMALDGLPLGEIESDELEPLDSETSGGLPSDEAESDELERLGSNAADRAMPEAPGGPENPQYGSSKARSGNGSKAAAISGAAPPDPEP